ncbi:MAG TPA: 6-pyruvoyl-tetrahydropterin synthase-related protein, partial [Anaeromyxobacteraceae bacterium]|nr:6-pyruvoyl-tetrahydropterin synthase-related protein [Anaeromyxobacteraceae bacterium]
MSLDPTTPAQGLAAREGRTTWAAVVVLAALATACCSPLAAPGWFASHESIRPIARALAAYHEVAAGDPYPRWVQDAYFGKGAPLFDFYPPAFSFLVAWAHALGVPLLLAAKGILFLLFVAGAVGLFRWVRPHLGHYPALVAAILYLFAPYHFVDLYVRGAVAEFTSLAAFPWLFLAIDRLVGGSSSRGFAALALSSAAIVLSHFLGALMIAPFAVAYAVVGAAHTKAAWRALGRVAAGASLGAALSAFFWLPALAERSALSPERLERSVTGYYTPQEHFVLPAQWLDPAWGFGPSAFEGFPDGMSFQVGLLLLGAVAASLALLRWFAKADRRFVLLSVAMGAAALWLTTASSSPFYAGGPLRWVQFPWRFLGPATLFLAAAGAGFARPLAAARAWAGPAVAAATAVLALAVSAPQRTVEGTIPLADDRVAIEAAVAEDPWSARFGNEDEFLPRDGNVVSSFMMRGGATLGGLGVKADFVQANRLDVTFGVSAPDGEGVAYVPWYQFPGWKVTLDGREWSFVPGPEGILAFRVPEGSHVARVYFGTTPVRVAGWGLAALGLLALGALR